MTNIISYLKSLSLNIWNLKDKITKCVLSMLFISSYTTIIIYQIIYKHYEIELSFALDVPIIIVGIIIVYLINYMQTNLVQPYNNIFHLLFIGNLFLFSKSMKIINDKIYWNWSYIIYCLILSIITYFTFRAIRNLFL